MQDRSSSAERLRNSRWNALASAPSFRLNQGLTLETPSVPAASPFRPMIDARPRTQPAPPAPEPRRRFDPAPRTGAGTRHEHSWLMRTLDRVSGMLWPLAVMDDLSAWLQEGSAGARVFLGVAAGMIAALLVFQTLVPLAWVQSLVSAPLFLGQGAFVLVLASVVAGATVLPVLFGLLIPLLTRLLVFAGICACGVAACFALWQLILSAKLL